jgi:hypothetical protein
MGARLYLPELGRFTSVDPIEGGTENNYVYPTDPVNKFDLTGEMSTGTKVAIGVGVAVLAVAAVCAVTAGGGCVVAVVRGAVWAGRSALVSKVAIRSVKTVVGPAKRLPAVIKNGNHVLRVGRGRISVGPAPTHYRVFPKLEKPYPLYIYI